MISVPFDAVSGCMEPMVEDGAVNSLTRKRPKNASEKAADNMPAQ